MGAYDTVALVRTVYDVFALECSSFFSVCTKFFVGWRAIRIQFSVFIMFLSLSLSLSDSFEFSTNFFLCPYRCRNFSRQIPSIDYIYEFLIPLFIFYIVFCYFIFFSAMLIQRIRIKTETETFTQNTCASNHFGAYVSFKRNQMETTQAYSMYTFSIQNWTSFLIGKK